MHNRTIIGALLFSAMFGTAVWGQDPVSRTLSRHGRPEHIRWQEEWLEHVVEYLDLSEAQTAEWQTITQQHRQAQRTRLRSVAALRYEFETLADGEDPNLEQLGQLALEIHQQMKSVRSSRQQVLSEAEGLLTAEQKERLETLRAAREFGERARQRRDRRHLVLSEPD